MNPEVDFFFSKATNWQAEIKLLRKIVLSSGLAEELKWGVPCYTLNGKNIVLIHAFKEYCALLFFKGALMKDTDGLLVQQTENVQSARQVRFTHAEEIADLEPILKAYIKGAIEVEKAGLKVDFKKATELVYPEEFENILTQNPNIKTAFEALTPGRQRAYNLYFSAPKQSKTRTLRIEKYVPQILNGKGLHDE